MEVEEEEQHFYFFFGGSGGGGRNHRKGPHHHVSRQVGSGKQSRMFGTPCIIRLQWRCQKSKVTGVLGGEIIQVSRRKRRCTGVSVVGELD